jgi:hypothetical protein
VVFENYTSKTSNAAIFSMVKVIYYVLQKMDWPTFWATFTQTHLDTLVGTLPKRKFHFVCFNEEN